MRIPTLDCVGVGKSKFLNRLKKTKKHSDNYNVAYQTHDTPENRVNPSNSTNGIVKSGSPVKSGYSENLLTAAATLPTGRRTRTLSENDSHPSLTNNFFIQTDRLANKNSSQVTLEKVKQKQGGRDEASMKHASKFGNAFSSKYSMSQFS